MKNAHFYRAATAQRMEQIIRDYIAAGGVPGRGGSARIRSGGHRLTATHSDCFAPWPHGHWAAGPRSLRCEPYGHWAAGPTVTGACSGRLAEESPTRTV